MSYNSTVQFIFVYILYNRSTNINIISIFILLHDSENGLKLQMTRMKYNVFHLLNDQF